MANLEYHPLANLFPLMEGEEFDALVADIKANHLHEPIILYEGKVLDGRNRHRACIAAGAEPWVTEWERLGATAGKTGPLGYVLSANLHRRHLTTQQRAAIAAELATMKVGDNQHKAVEPPSNDGPSVPSRFRPGHAKQRSPEALKAVQEALARADAMSTKQAAKAMKVSTASVERAKERKRTDPEAHAQAKAGTLPRKKPVARRHSGFFGQTFTAAVDKLIESHSDVQPQASPKFVGTCPGCGEPFGDTEPVRYGSKWFHPACAQPSGSPSEPISSPSKVTGPVDDLVAMYRRMGPRDRNEAAKQIIKAQLGETDLRPDQKQKLTEVLEFLTDYTPRY